MQLDRIESKLNRLNRPISTVLTTTQPDRFESWAHVLPLANKHSIACLPPRFLGPLPSRQMLLRA